MLQDVLKAILGIAYLKRKMMQSTYLLMLFPSLNLSATAPVLATRSDPARSTREIRLTFSPLTPL